MKHKLSFPVVVVCFCLSTALLISLMNLTGPSDFGIAGIFLVLLAVYLFFFSLFVMIARLTEAVRKFFANDVRNTTTASRYGRRSLFVSAALAFAPLLLISLNSLGQMQAWYLLLVLVFEGVAIFFIVKKV
jgi:hypothetical protein